MSRSLAILAVALFALSAHAQKAKQQQQVLQALDPTSCTVTTLDPDRSLVVTDPAVLARFPLPDVLQTIINRANVQNTTPTSLWSQWWSALRPRQTGDPSNEPHCDDNGTTINGYAIDCPRPESALENMLPATHVPVAIFNRFDLASMDGASCGEYRIVYAWENFSTFNRNFIIFEGVLPNPSPEDGPCGCKPVAEFWGDLTFENDVNVRADLIEDFFFLGLSGFEPIIRPEAYGLGGTTGGYASPGRTTGQIRTNMFFNGQTDPWSLREFGLDRVCTGGISAEQTEEEQSRASQHEEVAVSKQTCKLIVVPRPVANNPHPTEFTDNTLGGTTFQNDFVATMESLIPSPDGINLIGLAPQPDFDAGESISQFSSSQYNPSTNFTSLISNGLINLGSPGTPPFDATDMALRATTQSCAGCHQQSSNDDLGNGVSWPIKSPLFVHVTENSVLSNALTMTGGFLDHRQDILEEFLGFACDQGACPDVARQQGTLQAVSAQSAQQTGTLGGSVTH